MAQMTKEELLERLNGCETVEDVRALGHDLGKDISDEEAQQVIDALEAHEEDLTEEDLENMNGGSTPLISPGIYATALIYATVKLVVKNC